MTECVFHPKNHATAELIVRSAELGKDLPLPICDTCVERYDERRDAYADD